MSETVFRNARIVLANEVVTGSVQIRDGMIVAVDTGPAAHGEDFDGDLLMPGLVELHTDHFENHYRPRPGVTVNALGALQAHDAQVTAAGMTTVFDAVRIGSQADDGDLTADVEAQVDAIAEAKAHDMLRADHFVHLRCELPTRDALDHFEQHCGKPVVKLASVMDHTPGERQYVTLDHYIGYYQKRLRLSDAEMAEFIDARRAERDRFSDANRAAILKRGRAEGLVFASHDDATAAHVEEALRDGVTIAEFPTTLEAAQAAHAGGLAVLMGAPNVVRGGSHNGNISASDLASAQVLDVLSSDYVPYALMQATLMLPERAEGVTLPEAVAMVTRIPAEAAGLTDRGEIATGKRADIVRVAEKRGIPVVRSVWRQGRRVS